jgi:anti-anti-sigma regulatory factor
MRRSLVTSDPAELAAHDHVAWAGCGLDALYGVAVTAFGAAVRRGQQLMFVADDPDPERLAGLADRDDLLDRGALQLVSVSDTYAEPMDMAAQQAGFETALDAALAEGYTGICVVADNSESACGDDFAAWLEWEATADRLQSRRPITGICFFDTERVPEERLADVATLHPVVSDDLGAASYRLFADEGVVRVIGDLDTFGAARLERILQSAPPLTDGVIDVADVGFIDHAALLTLNRVAAAGDTLRIRGAKPIVRRLWDLLDVRTPALEFC